MYCRILSLTSPFVVSTRVPPMPFAENLTLSGDFPKHSLCGVSSASDDGMNLRFPVLSPLSVSAQINLPSTLSIENLILRKHLPVKVNIGSA